VVQPDMPDKHVARLGEFLGLKPVGIGRR